MKLYPGSYEGTVVDNNDPEDRGRVRVMVEGPYDPDESPENLPWATVAVQGVGEAGQHRIPPVGSEVAVSFRDGHPAFPFVTGGWLTTEDIRNDSEQKYTAGNRQDIVEGNIVQHAQGSQAITATEDLSLGTEGVFVINARAAEITTTGPSVMTTGALEQVVRGSEKKTVEGVAEHSYLGDAAVSVLGDLILGLLGKFEITTIRSIDITQYLSTLDWKVIAGELALRATDPTGLLTLGDVRVNTLFTSLSHTIALALSSGPTSMAMTPASAAISSADASMALTAGVAALSSAGTAGLHGPSVTLGSPTAADFVALSSKVDAMFLAMLTWAATHTHFVTSSGAPTATALPIPPAQIPTGSLTTRST